MKPVDGVEGLVAPNANGAGFGASAFVVGVSKIKFSYNITIFLNIKSLLKNTYLRWSQMRQS